jgi:hypothetical protein
MSEQDKTMADAEKAMSAIELVVRTLGPLASGERRRVIQAALVILGEESVDAHSGKGASGGEEAAVPNNRLPSRVQVWMKQNEVSFDQLTSVFDIVDGVASVIASGAPGKNNAEKTKNAYLLAGIANFLTSGEPVFDDKIARQLCETLGCYDGTNHSKYIREFGNNLTGSKDRGWRVTAPGLKNAAALIIELQSS